MLRCPERQKIVTLPLRGRIRISSTALLGTLRQIRTVLRGLPIGFGRLLWYCSTDQAADAFAVSMRAWNLRNSDDIPGERVERPLLPWEGRWKVWERLGWVTLS